METKRIVFLVAVYLAVLSVIVIYSLFDKQNEPNAAVRAGGTATGARTGAVQLTEKRDDPQKWYFDCILAQNNKDVYALYIKNDDFSQAIKIVGRNTEKAVFTRKVSFSDNDIIPEISITDFIISDEKMRFLDSTGDAVVLYEKRLLDNKKNTVQQDIVYLIRQFPGIYKGQLNSAVFVTPDIIRVSNTTGAIMHYKILPVKTKDNRVFTFVQPNNNDAKFKEAEKEPEICVKLVWWNGIGKREAAERPGTHSDCAVFLREPKFSEGKSFANWLRMDKKTKELMQQRVERNSAAKKIPK